MKKIGLGSDRRFQAVTLSILLSAPLSAAVNASEPVVRADGVLNTITLPCADEATRLMNSQLIRMAPDQMLDGMRRGFNKGDEWKPGDRKYEKARKIVVDALMAEEKESGPLFSFSAAKIMSHVTSSWSAEEKRYYAVFFAKQSGKLYLTDILDGATCKGWLKGLTQPPFTALSGADKARWDLLISNLNGGEERFLGKLRGLSKDERQSFEEGYKKLGSAFDTAPMILASQQDSAFKKRIEKAMAPHMPKILEIDSVN